MSVPDSQPRLDLEALYNALATTRAELLALADHEVHPGYAGAYRKLAVQVTKLMTRIELVLAARERRALELQAESDLPL